MNMSSRDKLFPLGRGDGNIILIMPNLDGVLFEWIQRANERCESFDLSIGIVEDSIALLKECWGRNTWNIYS